jgi:hypothetical protein
MICDNDVLSSDIMTTKNNYIYLVLFTHKDESQIFSPQKMHVLPDSKKKRNTLCSLQKES